MDENELLELSGTVDSVIYKNEENGYTVLRLRDENGEGVTVVGCFPYAAPGESMIVSGNWVSHSVHGKQFKAEFSQRMLPSTAPAIYEYLAGGAVRGIGPATAALIVNKFGDKTLDVLENAPQKLAEIKGISAAKAEQLSKSFRQQAGIRRLMEFVCSFGLRPVLAMRMYKYYGAEALELLRDNPYILASVHIGGSFAEADRLALEMGIDGYSANRICAAIIFELQHNSGNGHCFIPREQLAAATAKLIGVEPEDVDENIETLISGGQIRYEFIAGRNACYLPELYEAETNAAEILARMCRRSFGDKADINKIIAKLEKSQHISYAPLQKQVLELALKNQVVVLTGGPGTGKTTVARLVAKIYKQLGFLSKGQLIETDRSGLVAGYVGQTAGKVTDVVNSALGGILFIDEAYALARKGMENDFGHEAIDTLVKLMEDHRDDLVVIVAGYTDEMHDFLTSNPGLISRFNKYIDFPDYTDDELMAILEMNAGRQGYRVAEAAKAVVRGMLVKMTLSERMDFGNARGMRNTLEKLVQAQANRLAACESEVTRDMLEEITEADAKTALVGEEEQKQADSENVAQLAERGEQE